MVATLTFRALRAGVVTVTAEALTLTTAAGSTAVAVPSAARIRVAQ